MAATQKIHRLSAFLALAALAAPACLLAGFVNAATPPAAASLFAEARRHLEQSNQLGEQADRNIINANRLRKRINQLRARSRKTPDQTVHRQLNETTDNLVGQLQQTQTGGSELRQQSRALYYTALDLFEQGALVRWEGTILNRKPLSMDDSTSAFIAHNTKFRSVHPNMLNKMGTPTDNIDRSQVDASMSMLVPALAGQNAPDNLDIRSFQLSREQNYLAHIEVKAGDKADENTAHLVPFNKIHRWALFLSDLTGNPVTGARIEIVGHMPGHVHGLPTQPRVVGELAPGVYQVDGLKFQMKGWWVMQFNIATGGDAETEQPDAAANSTDSVVFNLVL
ncbi:hypothetical protein FKG94_12705 [Exilibacterium tricleocarpae]|uniref:YtkA-like domain-containing protein n=1 Tax=Exilibacterium tricleocarpae TaxID=2591008 RepID=A0A545TNS5_9GAMM|nr:FixH family protein [Exilibacterium tricleocarpae]TQV78873.1 hypothetical protein FKG94_12705 [Exilibacterium tricleocarpae]